MFVDTRRQDSKKQKRAAQSKKHRRRGSVGFFFRVVGWNATAAARASEDADRGAEGPHAAAAVPGGPAQRRGLGASSAQGAGSETNRARGRGTLVDGRGLELLFGLLLLFFCLFWGRGGGSLDFE